MHVLMRWGAIVPLSLFLSFPAAFVAIVPFSLPVIAQAQDSRKAEADRLLQQGIRQSDSYRYQEALQSYQQTLNLYQAIGDRAGEGAALNNFGETYRSLGRYPQALLMYQQALSIVKAMGNQTGEGIILSNVGSVYAARGQYLQALKSYQQALTLKQAVGNRAGEATTLNNIGMAYQALGQHPKALKTLQQALGLHREVSNRIGEGTTLSNIGMVYEALGQYPEAMENYQQALTLRRQTNGSLEGYIQLNNIGGIHRLLGQYPKALENYQQALTIARELGDRASEGTGLNNIGLVYQALGQYPKALENYQEALAVHRKVGNRPMEGTTLNNMGLIYDLLGQYPRALEVVQQALVIVREIGNRSQEGTMLNNIGGIYESVGQYSKALENYQQALAIAREVGDRSGEGTTLNNLGSVYIALKQYSKATESLQQALTNIREVGDRPLESTLLINIGVVYQSLGQYSKALKSHQQALVIARAVGNRETESTTLSNIGELFFTTNQFADAEKSLFAALAVVQSLRDSKLSDTDRITLFERQLLIYLQLQETLVAQNSRDKNLSALEISEQGRARSLVEELAGRYLTASGKAETDAPNLAAIRQIAREQKATLVQYSVVSLESRDPSLYIWVIKPTGEIAFKLVNLKALDRPLAELVVASRQAIGARNRPDGTVKLVLSEDEQKRRQAEQRRNLQQLYQLLIQPIAAELPQKESDRVVFMPQDALFIVPFAALMDGNGKYLVEKHTLTISPSIQVLDLTQKRQRLGRGSREARRSLQSNQALVVGNPTMPKVWNAETNKEDKQLSNLPGSEQEAIVIANTLQTQPLLGKQATKAAVMQRMETARIIHLATHGLLEYGNPKDSGVRDVPGAIALGSSGTDSGLLTAAEILQLKLNADLVVLSACDTGRGNIRGEGVVGLSRSFMRAGVPSLVVSLWAVDDAATAELMQTFYSLWQHTQQPMDKAQALRQAMLATMKKHPDPYLWAAFTLIGGAE